MGLHRRGLEMGQPKPAEMEQARGIPCVCHESVIGPTFFRPFLAHFSPVFSRFFAIFSVWPPRFQKPAPRPRKTVRNGRETAAKRGSKTVSSQTQSTVRRAEARRCLSAARTNHRPTRSRNLPSSTRSSNGRQIPGVVRLCAAPAAAAVPPRQAARPGKAPQGGCCPVPNPVPKESESAAT